MLNNKITFNCIKQSFIMWFPSNFKFGTSVRLIRFCKSSSNFKKFQFIRVSYSYNVFLSISFFSNQQNNHPISPFLLQYDFILINKLSHWYNSSLVACTSFMEDFRQTNVFAWICTIFVHSIIGWAIQYLINQV